MPKLIKGETYVLKVTLSSPNQYDSINWYADTTNPYQYGMMSLPGNTQPLYWDLAARVEGVNRAVDSMFTACNGEIYGVPADRAPVRDSLARLMTANGVGFDREVLEWYRVQDADSTTFYWDGFDSIMQTTAQKGIKVLPILYRTPHWAATHASYRIRMG